VRFHWELIASRWGSALSFHLGKLHNAETEPRLKEAVTSWSLADEHFRGAAEIEGTRRHVGNDRLETILDLNLNGAPSVFVWSPSRIHRNRGWVQPDGFLFYKAGNVRGNRGMPTRLTANDGVARSFTCRVGNEVVGEHSAAKVDHAEQDHQKHGKTERPFHKAAASLALSPGRG
jgi:hypothetical protein